MRINVYLWALISATIFCMVCCATKQPTSSSPMKDLQKSIIKGEDYMATGLTFEEDLDFNQLFTNSSGQSIHIESQLRFVNCTFKGRINWSKQQNRKLYFSKDIVFEGCTFDEDVILNDAVFYGILQLGGNVFRHSLDLQRIRCLINARIDDNEIGQDMILQYSKFQDDISLFGNVIGHQMLMQGLSVQGNAQLSNTSINNAIDISNSFFHQEFLMDYCKGGTKLLVGNSHFMGRFQIKQLEGFDIIDFSRCDFRGSYLFSNKNEAIKPNLDQVKFSS